MQDSWIVAFHGEIEKVLQHLKSEFAKLQTGRANAALAEHICVEAYGTKQPLRNIAGITVTDARTIVVQPWDRSILQNVERALQQANLGGSPVNDGTVIRISLPPMTEERRAQLRKIVSQLAEEARISVRQHRQTVHDQIKTEKDEDVRETMMQQLQKAVEDANAKVADAAGRKEEEVMTV